MYGVVSLNKTELSLTGLIELIVEIVKIGGYVSGRVILKVSDGLICFFFFFVLGGSEWVNMKLGTLVLLGFGYLE